MALEHGLGITPWSPLKSGLLTGKYTRDNVNEAKGGRGAFVNGSLNERTFALIDDLTATAKTRDTTVAKVALSWVVSRPAVTSTIIGARTIRQLEENLGSLAVTLFTIDPGGWPLRAQEMRLRRASHARELARRDGPKPSACAVHALKSWARAQPAWSLGKPSPVARPLLHERVCSLRRTLWLLTPHQKRQPGLCCEQAVFISSLVADMRLAKRLYDHLQGIPMSDNEAEDVSDRPSAEPNVVVSAFRLGWLIAELYGLASRRRPAREGKPHDQVLRLTVSTGYARLSNADLLQADMQLLPHVASPLGLWDTQSQDEPLLAEILRVCTTQEAPSEREIFEAFEAWSIDAQARLLHLGEKPALALCFGASLADTYWFMQEPQAPGASDKRHKKRTWKALLYPKRLRQTRERLTLIEDDLGRLPCAMLVHSLKQWEADAKERLFPSGKGEREDVHLSFNEEMKLIAALRSQVRSWRPIILGVRHPASFLWDSDRLAIRIIHVVLFIFLVATTAALASGALVAAISLVNRHVLPLISPTSLERPGGLDASVALVKEIISLVALVVPAVATLWSAFLWLRGRLSNLNEWIRDKLVEFFARRRIVTMPNHAPEEIRQRKPLLDPA